MYETNLKEEQRIKGAFAAAQQADPGSIGRETEGCGSHTATCRPGLIDRVRMQADAANGEVNRAMRLGELRHLLEKNPDVARILDLMESVR